MKFLHTGDHHLNRTFYQLDPSLADTRRKELWLALEGQVKTCIEKEIPYLFLTGDLFDQEGTSKASIDRFMGLIKGGPQVVVIKGNHDYKVPLKSQGNFHLIEGTQSLDFPKDRLRVHGQSWTGPNPPRLEDLSTLTPLKGGWNICLLHGDFSAKDLDQLPFLQRMDYIALGHIHKPGKLSDKAYYPGSPEPLDPSDLGDRGYILGDLEGGALHFVQANTRAYHRVELDDCIDFVQDLLDRLEPNKRDFYQVILKGPTDPDLGVDLMEANLKAQGYHISIDNQGLDLGLIKAYLDRGDVFSKLLAKVQAGLAQGDLDPAYLQEVLSIYKECLEE